MKTIVKIPLTPNFLIEVDTGYPVPVYKFTTEELRKIGKKWTTELIKKATKKRNDKKWMKNNLM